MSSSKRNLLLLLLCGVAASLIWVIHVKRQTVKLPGAVIVRSSDVRKQLPIADVTVTANDGTQLAKTSSDSTGMFTILLHRQLLRGQREVTLCFRHSEFEPLDLVIPVSNRLTVA